MKVITCYIKDLKKKKLFKKHEKLKCLKNFGRSSDDLWGVLGYCEIFGQSGDINWSPRPILILKAIYALESFN